MSKVNRPRGQAGKERGKAFSQAELDAIRLLLDRGQTVAQVAATLKRGRASIYRLKAAGLLSQVTMDFGA